jgi:hypothetical protein
MYRDVISYPDAERLSLADCGLARIPTITRMVVAPPTFYRNLDQQFGYNDLLGGSPLIVSLWLKLIKVSQQVPPAVHVGRGLLFLIENGGDIWTSS